MPTRAVLIGLKSVPHCALNPCRMGFFAKDLVVGGGVELAKNSDHGGGRFYRRLDG
jgi:hypothetical protein